MNALSMIVLSLVIAILAPLPLYADEIKLTYALSLYADDKGDGMKGPQGVACADTSTVIVADSGNGRLLRYSLQTKAIKAAVEIRTPELSNPILVRTNAQGEIFVLDGKQRRILRLNPDGSFKGYVDPAGLPASSMVVPRSFAIDRNGDLYVLDILAGRVLALGPDGNFRREIKLPGNYGFISDLALDPQGSILALDSVDAAVYAASKDAGTFAPLIKSSKDVFSFPVAITTDAKGMIYVVDRNAGGVVILRRDGTAAGKLIAKGWKEGFMNYPTQLCINEKGELFVADRENNRIQVFTVVQ